MREEGTAKNKNKNNRKEKSHKAEKKLRIRARQKFPLRPHHFCSGQHLRIGERYNRKGCR